MSAAEVKRKWGNALEKLKATRLLAWKDTTGSARKWWDAFETRNKHRPTLIFRLATGLRHRAATITELFLAYVYANTDNIQANLHHLDDKRLKEQGDKKPPRTEQRQSEPDDCQGSPRRSLGLLGAPTHRRGQSF